MEEIKVGEYVRTKNQGIFIISHINIDFDDSDFKKVCICQNKKVAFTNIDTIKELKHSPSIIDLIEVGDYVNGYKVLDIMEDMETGEIHLEMTSDYTNEIIGDCTIYNDDIKTILTHEQMSNIEYRLEN